MDNWFLQSLDDFKCSVENLSLVIKKTHIFYFLRVFDPPSHAPYLVREQLPMEIFLLHRKNF